MHAEHTLNTIFTAKTLKLGLQLTKFHFFSPVPKSPIRTGLISVKNPLSNISCLGPFKGGSPKKILEKKNVFPKKYVELRTFDGIKIELTFTFKVSSIPFRAYLFSHFSQYYISSFIPSSLPFLCTLKFSPFPYPPWSPSFFPIPIPHPHFPLCRSSLFPPPTPSPPGSPLLRLLFIFAILL